MKIVRKRDLDETIREFFAEDVLNMDSYAFQWGKMTKSLLASLDINTVRIQIRWTILNSEIPKDGYKEAFEKFKEHIEDITSKNLEPIIYNEKTNGDFTTFDIYIINGYDQIID